MNGALVDIASAVRDQVAVLRRLPEKMDPALYHRTFRPYIRFFENVVYEGVSEAPMNFRGETGAQSSIMPALVAFMKIPHQPSVLTNHLADMRRFMPPSHRELLGEIEAMPSIRDDRGCGCLQRRARADGDLPRDALQVGARVHQSLDGRSARHRRDALHELAQAAHRRNARAQAVSRTLFLRLCLFGLDQLDDLVGHIQ